MNEYQFEALVEAWHKLQDAQLQLEQVPDDPKEYRNRYDAVLNALDEYRRVLERLKPYDQRP